MLESAEGVPKVARYSILGKAEGKVIFKNGKLKVESFTEFGDKAKDLEGKYECPLDALREVRNEYLKYIDISNIEPIPRFKGGLVGYLSYDIIRYWIDLSNINPKPINDLKFPDAEFFIVKDFISFDLKEKVINLIAEDDEGIRELERIIKNAKIGNNDNKEEKTTENKDLKIKSNMSKEEFIEAVKKAKEYIFAGDIFQVVLSRRIEIDLDNLDHLKIYKKLER